MQAHGLQAPQEQHQHISARSPVVIVRACRAWCEQSNSWLTTQDNPRRGCSWHSSQTGSQPDLLAETQFLADTLEASPETKKGVAPISLTREPSPEKIEEKPAAPSNPTTGPSSTEPTTTDGSPSEKQAAAPSKTGPGSPTKPITTPRFTEPATTHGALSACGNTKPDSKGKSKDSGAQDAKQEKPDDDDDEYETPLDDKPPPPPISKKTLMKRLARICTPKEDGTYKVPEEIIQSHKNLETRDTVYRAFEKCGYDPVQPPRLRGALPPKP